MSEAFRGLGPLIRIGWRSIRKAPIRSLLIFGLVALVVAAGTFAAIVNRSTSANADDTRLAEFGGSNFRADFGTRNYGGNGYRPIAYGPNEIPIPVPPQVVPGPLAVPVPGGTSSQADFEARQREDEAWLATFDAGASEAEIERALGVDVSIERQGQVFTAQGPFGSQGPIFGLLTDLDLDHPAARGVATLLQGRAPNAPGEIAIGHQDRAGYPVVGDQVTVGSATLSVVGIVTSPANRHQPITLVTPDTFDTLIEPQARVTFAVRANLPNANFDAPLAAEVIQTSVDRRVSIRTPDSVLANQGGEWVRYPYSGDEWQAGAVVPRIWPILITGLLATQIALVCAAAFAVGIRRRTKEFGQLMTLGADDRHIRRLAQVEAALLGVLAAVLGLIIGVIASNWIISAGWIDSAGNRIPTGVRWSLVDWVGPAAVGIVAVVIAAWWPTRVLNDAPIPGVLEGRLPSVPVRKATPRRGLVLVAVGTAFLGLGAQTTINAGDQPGAAFALVALGIVTMILGSLLLIGTLLSFIGQRADRFPLLARLVVRNSDRQRSRSWVVVGAFIAALALPIVIGASIKAYPNSYQANVTSELEAQLLITSRVTVTAGTEVSSDEEIVDFDTDFGAVVGENFTVAEETEFVLAPRAQIVWVSRSGGYGGGRVVVATDGLIELLDLDQALVDELDAGKVVDISTFQDQWANGEPRFINDSSQRVNGTPLEVVDGPALFGQTWLMSPEALEARGTSTISIGTIRRLAEPLNATNEETIRQLGNELWVERFGAFDYGRATGPEAELSGWLDLSVNRNHHSGVSASAVRLWSTLISIGLALLVAFVTSALSAVELTPEIESMIATGAAPSIRRRMLGAQTLYHLLVAATMAIPLAILAFWAVTRADGNGRPTGLTVPWQSIGITAILVPVVVAVAVAATFRNGKPAVSRRLS